ncbi:MAG: proline--tRNA ligase [Clostridia bacterium]|nr:proline--tRNA ligase [Clostridia bacterium]
MENKFVQDIADFETNYAQWYTDVVTKTEMADYGPVKGTMVIRPYGYAIWENIQNELDRQFKLTGHQNAYFPLLFPYSFLTKEKEHVEGFAPEVALVTEAGGEELGEKLVIRPTSETVICNMFSKWVKSYRDLPVKVNQWANVMRWEKTTRPFLRTSEFLWQEGHTLHETEEEARQETLQMLEIYRKFAEDFLAIPAIVGKKTEKEKFAGAVDTYTFETMTRDGKSLQSGTSHYLGTNFAQGFNIKFQNKNGEMTYPHQTSWGSSTRLIGALICAHGDQRGLVLPPKIAPIQVVIVPITLKNDDLVAFCKDLNDKLTAKGIRVNLDLSDTSAGFKFNKWELKGVPVRLEIGNRDLEQGIVTYSRRDTCQKATLNLNNIEQNIIALLDEIQANMLETARAKTNAHIIDVDNRQDLINTVNAGNFVRVTWCGDRSCEENLKNETAITSRCMPFEQSGKKNKCACCGKELKDDEGFITLFAKAY